MGNHRHRLFLFLGGALIFLSAFGSSQGQAQVNSLDYLYMGNYSPTETGEPTAFLQTAWEFYTNPNGDFRQLVEKYRDFNSLYFYLAFTPQRTMLGISGDRFHPSSRLKLVMGRKIDGLLMKGMTMVKDPKFNKAEDDKMLSGIETYWPAAGKALRTNHERALEFLSYFNISKDQALIERTNRIVKQLAPFTNDKALRGAYKVVVIDIDMDQGFATGGGTVYLTKSLVEAMTDDELAGVIAHEMGHSELGHLVKNIDAIRYDIFDSIVRVVKAYGQKLILKTKSEFGHPGDAAEMKRLEALLDEGVLGGILNGVMGQRSVQQETEADQRAEAITKACGCYNPQGVHLAIKKLLQRHNILNIGSLRHYPDAYERAGIATRGQKIIDVPRTSIESFVEEATQSGLNFPNFTKALKAVRNTRIMNSPTLEALYSGLGMNSKIGDLDLGLTFYDVRTNQMSRFAAVPVANNGVMFHELFHAYVQGVLADEKPELKKLMAIRARARFPKLLSGQQGEYYEELLAHYVESMVENYQMYKHKLKTMLLTERESRRLNSMMRTKYENVAKGQFDAYAGQVSGSEVLEPEDRQLVNQIIFDGRLSGDFAEDFSEENLVK